MVKETRCDSRDRTLKNFRKRVKVGTYVVLGEAAWPAEPEAGERISMVRLASMDNGVVPRDTRKAWAICYIHLASQELVCHVSHENVIVVPLRTISIQRTLRRKESARADGGQ
jgi:hypothetical protein